MRNRVHSMIHGSVNTIMSLRANDDAEALKTRSQKCDLCRLLYKPYVDYCPTRPARFKLWRIGGVLKFDQYGTSANLSLVAGKEVAGLPDYLPIGLPNIPVSKSDLQVNLLRQWLTDCDKTHKCRTGKSGFMPTRVIEISGNIKAPKLRLRCWNNETKGSYVALSHQWGDPEKQRRLRTLSSNYKEHLDDIPFDGPKGLPGTFRDAVEITLRLGISYLWIDSLCIIQENDDDWMTESKRMEDVFSNAYFTIAASRAVGMDDGFLKSRPSRTCIPLKSSEGQYYICECIDDFHRDAEEAGLNKRGWVYQERALSTRSIFFTERQVYWECGYGVRCETLTWMKNSKASFLGDPNFPNAALEWNKSMRIRLYETIYKRYSKLALTRPSDRPAAIQGLESRLARTFHTNGKWGIFERFLYRSLLWRHVDGVYMQPIHDDPPGSTRKIPSWSWTAYIGEIDFIDAPLGETHWTEEVDSPFDSDQSAASTVTGRVLSATARRLMSRAGRFLQSSLMFDCAHHQDMYDNSKDSLQPEGLKCIVVGKRKGTSFPSRQDYYVILIIPGPGERRVYERVGVGIVDGRDVEMKEPGERVQIV
ncbi:HET-domain-containing protein [Lepidopterella palustris CBS 459.81]|uniref:HET-domain-containing protein n=1 Tax=Lepidopterella palustris CBS 459.81 TaxID=1314670 RepID=A0A8E2E4B8_9PEZI|nr:HET-domain-containing protein [Lepidopterella palustris CBS 459.81]